MPHFEKAHDLTLKDNVFFDVGTSNVTNIHNTHNHRTRSGLDRLEEASLQEAMRDSSAREIPRCFEGTRTEHRRSITSWGRGEWKSQNARVLWMDGPAGVGKSAIAQTWTEELDDKFAAAFFFSRANGWNQPIKLIPTIAYQLATKYDSYRTAVDAVISRNPLLLQQSIDTQFQGLLVKPLHELNSEDRMAMEDAIIVIDGLDECGSLSTKVNSLQAQVAIIKAVTLSVATGTSPFLWGFFTRPESHIVTAFRTKQATEITWHLTLPLKAPNVDKDMESYLRDAFGTIRLKYPSIPSSWPSDDSLVQLVKQSGGLFAYGTSAVRYIEHGSGGTSDSRLGPEERLRMLLEPGEGSRAGLSKLDQLYLLVMDQIPKDTLPNTLFILRANTCVSGFRHRVWKTVPILSSLLGFSQPAFYDAIAPLSSVLQVFTPDGELRADRESMVDQESIPGGSHPSHPSLRFYHASFTDFLTNPERCTREYYIQDNQLMNNFYSTCIDALYRPLTLLSLSNRYDDWLDDFKNDEQKMIAIRQLAMATLIDFPSQLRCLPDAPKRLAHLNWSTEAEAYEIEFFDHELKSFAKHIPMRWRFRVIRPKNLALKALWVAFGVLSGSSFVLGRGSKRALLISSDGGYQYGLKPYSKD